MHLIVSGFAVASLLTQCSTSEKEKGGSQVVDPAETGTRIIGEQSEPDTLKGSLKAVARGTVGDAGITINYYSPAVRGRVIWGGLVPFDNVWVTGAHSATNIEFNQEVVIGGVVVAPGKYALFTIPGRETWTIVINRNWTQHLADDYDSKEDVVRIEVTPEREESHQERLRYVIEEEEGEGEIVMYWEKLELSLPVASSR